ncbi:MAG: siphovirus ReqiPepy6 Gp37-like family protein [Tissierellia bacterium]|nr:siphovirus ReqiPepy6 Gp37-like family protein [Tissierellia bacterium]
MLLKGIEIYVFKLDDNGSFDAIGEINQFTSLIWPDKFNGYATFELWAPITPENKTLIKEGNILWCGGDNAAIIEIIQSSVNANGEKSYKIKGRTLEMYLTTRIVWGTYDCYNKFSSTAMYEIVNRNCINPTKLSRKIPFLENAIDEQIGDKITYQKTGGEVYDALIGIASASDLGFDVLFRPKEKKLIFKVIEGVDRSIMPAYAGGINPVIFSTDLESILTSSYYKNEQDVKSVALVAGEGLGASRKQITSGDDTSTGFLRRELYIDARDLQSEILNDDGTTSTISEEEYNEMLDTRGSVKLSECVVVETFEAKVRDAGNTQYMYGVDYKKGDKVIIRDDELGVQTIGKITEINQNYGDKYELIITFGYEYPTLIQKIKQQIL